ncbi:Flotillin-2 [Cichlidogyrus casuarinus]|uniref:Flotillin-2 n=1 Tax=Cichlidogyrus casuarinus TaxID=1844966 RepID=A0ABD2PVC9_9PLAT
MGNIHTVGPNEVLVISGGCFGTNKVKSIVGGYGWAWWFISEVQRLCLEVMSLKPRCEHVETSEGVSLTVTGVAQVKFMKDEEFLSAACEQFLGKSKEDIEDTLLQTLEGHLRAILGTLTVEEVYKVILHKSD